MGGVAFSRPVAIHLGHWIRLLGWIPFVTALLLKYPRHTLAAIGEGNNANCAVKRVVEGRLFAAVYLGVLSRLPPWIRFVQRLGECTATAASRSLSRTGRGCCAAAHGTSGKYSLAVADISKLDTSKTYLFALHPHVSACVSRAHTITWTAPLRM
jgi:hypothetical protein